MNNSVDASNARFLGTVTVCEIMARYFKIFYSLDSLGSIFLYESTLQNYFTVNIDYKIC